MPGTLQSQQSQSASSIIWFSRSMSFTLFAPSLFCLGFVFLPTAMVARACDGATRDGVELRRRDNGVAWRV